MATLDNLPVEIGDWVVDTILCDVFLKGFPDRPIGLREGFSKWMEDVALFPLSLHILKVGSSTLIDYLISN
jgi:hypothetical protein